MRWTFISRADASAWLASVCIEFFDDKQAKAVNEVTVPDLLPEPRDCRFTQKLRGASLCVECISGNSHTLRTTVDGFLRDVQLIINVVGR